RSRASSGTPSRSAPRAWSPAAKLTVTSPLRTTRVTRTSPSASGARVRVIRCMPLPRLTMLVTSGKTWPRTCAAVVASGATWAIGAVGAIAVTAVAGAVGLAGLAGALWLAEAVAAGAAGAGPSPAWASTGWVLPAGTTCGLVSASPGLSGANGTMPSGSGTAPGVVPAVVPAAVPTVVPAGEATGRSPTGAGVAVPGAASPDPVEAAPA